MPYSKTKQMLDSMVNFTKPHCSTSMDRLNTCPKRKTSLYCTNCDSKTKTLLDLMVNCTQPQYIAQYSTKFIQKVKLNCIVIHTSAAQLFPPFTFSPWSTHKKKSTSNCIHLPSHHHLNSKFSHKFQTSTTFFVRSSFLDASFACFVFLNLFSSLLNTIINLYYYLCHDVPTN